MATSIDWQEPDQMLQALVSLVNVGRISFGITLIVNGNIISGTVISSKEYVKTIENMFETVAGDTLETDISMLRAFKEISDSLLPAIASDTSPEQSMIEFIHLKDVQSHSDDVEFSSHTPAWRIRLSAINGWMMGG